MPLSLLLVDPQPGLCAAWLESFSGLPRVRIHQARFEELAEYDCMVSAANSFGLMDGGVDAAIRDYFGLELVQRVQARILEDFLGEQPVGTSFIVETGHADHPYLAHTPTMRVPEDIAGTDAVYRATWAMLLAVHRHNGKRGRLIRTVACPGLGTMTGRMPFSEAAAQMAAAWRHYQSPPSRLDWDHALEREASVVEAVEA
jgi:O-acetyl-ADP-ribose deacetylase (regulator of RNase III)